MRSCIPVFLKDISEQCRKVKADCFVCYAAEDGDVKELKDILGKQKEYFPQTGKSLGQRMYHSLEYVLGLGYDVCLLMGTDIPEVSSPDLEKAFQVLKEKDAVFGRTADGGYYLVGMKPKIIIAWNPELEEFNSLMEKWDNEIHAELEKSAPTRGVWLPE